MKRTQRHTPARLSASAGLSLLELLVALAVVSLVIATAALSVSLGRDRARAEVEAFALQLSRADAEAIAAGRFIGLRLEPGGTGYDFLVYADGAWRELRGRPGLDRNALSPDWRLRLAGAPPPRAGLAERPEDAPLQPDIWFDPTGLTDPFRLLADDGARRFELVFVDGTGVMLSEVE